MAKKRKKVAKTITRYKYAKKRSSKKSSNKMSFLNGFVEPLSAVSYGFIRDKMSDAIANTEIAKKLPASQYTDELVMYGIAWGSGKMGLNKIPIARSLVKVAKVVELSRIGMTFSDIQQAKKSTTTNVNGVVNNSQMVIIG